MRDYEAGRLYGLEKFWAFLHYSKRDLEINPKVKELLQKYKTVDDFRINVSFRILLQAIISFKLKLNDQLFSSAYFYIA